MIYPFKITLKHFVAGQLFALAFLLSVPAWGADDYTDAEKLFALKVKPLLKQKCFSCHNDEDLKGDLVMTSAGK